MFSRIPRFGLLNFTRNDKVVPFPPPFRAMIAINSDIEWTRWNVQLALLQEFACRSLETAFSFWLFGSPKVTWRVFEDNGSPTSYARAAFSLARDGLLDTNHSIGGRRHLGGCRYDRESIRKAYKVLRDEGVIVPAYSNHGGEADKQNVAGNWAQYQEGDLPGSSFYHLDLTLNAGTRFFWCDPDYVVGGAGLKASVGESDSIFVRGFGRDGNKFIRFRRYMGQPSAPAPSLDNFGRQIEELLSARPHGYSVVFQHLGVERNPDGTPAPAAGAPFRPEVLRSLDRLSEAQKVGEVLVTTTARLLNHAAMMAARSWRINRESGCVTVHFDPRILIADVELDVTWEMLQGWTLEANRHTEGIAVLKNEERRLCSIAVKDRTYLGLPWERLDAKTAIVKAAELSGCSVSLN